MSSKNGDCNDITQFSAYKNWWCHFTLQILAPTYLLAAAPAAALRNQWIFHPCEANVRDGSAMCRDLKSPISTNGSVCLPDGPDEIHPIALVMLKNGYIGVSKSGTQCVLNSWDILETADPWWSDPWKIFLRVRSHQASWSNHLPWSILGTPNSGHASWLVKTDVTWKRRGGRGNINVRWINLVCWSRAVPQIQQTGVDMGVDIHPSVYHSLKKIQTILWSLFCGITFGLISAKISCFVHLWQTRKYLEACRLMNRW